MSKFSAFELSRPKPKAREYNYDFENCKDKDCNDCSLSQLSICDEIISYMVASAPRVTGEVVLCKEIYRQSPLI
jgi:hypothetical protein